MLRVVNDPKRLAQIALVTLLIIGCIAVLLPFIGAILFAFVIWVCAWPAYEEKVLRRLGNRATVGATLVTASLVLFLLLPTIFLASSLASSADTLIELIRPYIEGGLPSDPPDWLATLPLIGSEIADFWHHIAGDRAALNEALRQLILPAREFLLGLGGIVANGLLQVALVLFVAFFLFRDGTTLSRLLQKAAEKLGGALGTEMLRKAHGTVFGVMLGILGTAAAQGTVAMLGFLVAGVPAAVLLAFATFFLSMIPVGPPLIWGAAAFWLHGQGETGWAIFMVAYGVLVISSIDNIVKPILMARGAGLSILTIALGVFGGVLMFGFIGIFLGPVLLALGQMLLMRWLREDSPT